MTRRARTLDHYTICPLVADSIQFIAIKYLKQANKQPKIKIKERQKVHIRPVPPIQLRRGQTGADAMKTLPFPSLIKKEKENFTVMGIERTTPTTQRFQMRLAPPDKFS